MSSRRSKARLKKAEALSAGRAVALDLRTRSRKLLDQALAAGTVQRTDDGRLYLNERAIADRKEGQGFMAMLILLMIASAHRFRRSPCRQGRQLTIDGPAGPMAKAAGPFKTGGCSSMVEQKPSKLTTRVRFPSPAPDFSSPGD